MADTNYIVPGAGIIQDQQLAYNLIIPGAGIYQEQELGIVVLLYYYMKLLSVG